ncbi:MAG: N-acetyl-alpha-D-glucosaminyl L-malate synthase [Candidatus Ordinivivax streblomastigis]|uniref:N-acetyl-alpha-D-glucosaminyl L-malate synthase n=1 Tax=Candidatus Ordinivivax streblomastigis TaxID=2540710 RepID=A0A5M8P265_9BACT|nr:MAG: N-acetyl-alpha-D-glucosaminyl L-malate synthase [Candidatus Ordinivivax streblomastigis]
MNKLLQINVSANTGSTGTIAEEIAKIAIANGYDSYIAYGRSANESKSKLIKIETECGIRWHGLKSRLLDQQGLASKGATKRLIKEIDTIIQPDIIQIHNLHGYYIHYELLFEYLNKQDILVVWTFHDCWPITGHCSHFEFVACCKWQTECNRCPNRKGYPRSLFMDNSKNNFYRKKELFSSCKNLTIVTPSVWLSNIVKQSFLSDKNIVTINNGIDTTVFQPTSQQNIRGKYSIANDKFVILGVANTWGKRKGYNDFLQLSEQLGDKEMIVLVGLNEQQKKGLPENIIGISKTENTEELAQIYSMAEVFVNPTWVDNFPTTNIEALACGTPVVTYRTGGSPEAINTDTGWVVEKGNIVELKKAIDTIREKGKSSFSEKCRQRAVELYSKEDRYNDYIQLYNSLLS